MADEDDARRVLARFRAYEISFEELAFDKFSETMPSFDFLEEDVVNSMCNLLVEIANQCKLQYIKLRLLQTALAESIEVEDGEVSIGLDSFKGND